MKLTFVDQLLSSEAVTAGTSQTSSVNVGDSDELFIAVKGVRTSGNISFQVQASPNDTDWFNLDDGLLELTSTVNDELRLTNFSKYVRVQYTSTGNWTVDLWLTRKSGAYPDP